MCAHNVRRILHWTASIAWLLAWWPVAAVLTQVPDRGDRVTALEMFEDRVARYAAIRERLEEQLPPYDPARDDWSRTRSRSYLAAAIRRTCPDAQRQVFLPSVAVVFRQLTSAGPGTDVRPSIDPEYHASHPLIELRVHEPVPAWAMEPVPADVLARLPRLPAGVEYRTVGADLILWDAHAEILIEALPGAFLPP